MHNHVDGLDHNVCESSWKVVREPSLINELIWFMDPRNQFSK